MAEHTGRTERTGRTEHTGRAERAARAYAPGPVRVGVDVTAVAEVDAAVSSFGQRYVRRLFTDHEIESCGAADPHEGTCASLAARFAAKEAVLKVLEPTGTRPQWRDIEIVRRESGACRVRLHGRAASLARIRGVRAMSVSLTHEAGLAVAVVAAACDPPIDTTRGSERRP